jgi:dTDP-4-amino-4,6-dideoxygalactose transaminase
MSDSAVPLADPKAGVIARRADIDAAIARVLDRGQYILGEEVTAFEREFADYIGRQYCVGVSSGTDALTGALRALDPAPTDYVVTVSHTSVATVTAIDLARAKPLLIDIDASTFTLDPQELAQVLEHPPGRIAAIIAVHLYGQAADLEVILPLARRYGVPVIEDCAQCHGAKLGQMRLGRLGAMAAFSFYPTKNLPAIGDGGAILLDDPQLFERLKAYRQYGWRIRQVSEFIGACSRLDEVQAAVLRTRLLYLEDENARRRQIAERYREGLDGLPLRCPFVRTDALPVFHQYVVRTPGRDVFREALQRRGVNTGIHYPVPVHLQPAYRDRVVLGPSGLVRSERAAREVLSLPMYPQLSDHQVEHVINAVRNVCREIG